MEIIEKTLFLKQVALFNEIELERLVIIAEKCDFSQLEKKQTIVEPDQNPKAFYLIVEGEVVLENKTGLKKTIHKNQFFGEKELITETPYTYKASSQEKCSLFTLSKGNFLTILYECPEISIILLKECYLTPLTYKQ